MKKMLIALTATAVLGMGTAMAVDPVCLGEAAAVGVAATAITGNVGVGIIAGGMAYSSCENKNENSNPYSELNLDDNSGWE